MRTICAGRFVFCNRSLRLPAWPSLAGPRPKAIRDRRVVLFERRRSRQDRQSRRQGKHLCADPRNCQPPSYTACARIPGGCQGRRSALHRPDATLLSGWTTLRPAAPSGTRERCPRRGEGDGSRALSSCCCSASRWACREVRAWAAWHARAACAPWRPGCCTPSSSNRGCCLAPDAGPTPCGPPMHAGEGALSLTELATQRFQLRVLLVSLCPVT